MDDAKYTALTTQLFKRLLKACDGVDPDVLDADGGGDMVTITAVASGEKVIVNTQRAVKQIWVAGKGQGVHFSYDDASARWLDDRGQGVELLSWIDECVRAASGVSLADAARG